jgi:hypothetical protein
MWLARLANQAETPRTSYPLSDLAVSTTIFKVTYTVITVPRQVSINSIFSPSVVAGNQSVNTQPSHSLQSAQKGQKPRCPSRARPHSSSASKSRWPLDAFLVANNVDETFGTPPFYKDHPDHDPISELLLAKIARFDEKADKTNFRVIMPSVEGDDIATTAYVTYAWVSVEVHREVKLEHNHLPAEPPKGFEELRSEILAFGDKVAAEERIVDDGKMGVYLVFTYDLRGMCGPLLESHQCTYCEVGWLSLPYASSPLLTRPLACFAYKGCLLVGHSRSLLLSPSQPFRLQLPNQGYHKRLKHGIHTEAPPQPDPLCHRLQRRDATASKQAPHQVRGSPDGCRPGRVEVRQQRVGYLVQFAVGPMSVAPAE